MKNWEVFDRRNHAFVGVVWAATSDEAVSKAEREYYRPATNLYAVERRSPNARVKQLVQDDAYVSSSRRSPRRRD